MLQIVLFHAEAHRINPGSSYLFPPANMLKVSKLTNDKKENVESSRNGGRIQYRNLIINTTPRSYIFHSLSGRLLPFPLVLLQNDTSKLQFEINLGAFMRNCFISVGFTHFPFNISKSFSTQEAPPHVWLSSNQRSPICISGKYRYSKNIWRCQYDLSSHHMHIA